MMVVAKARSWPAIENNDGPATPVAGTALAGEADAADALAVIVNVVVAHANQTQEQHGGSTSRTPEARIWPKVILTGWGSVMVTI